MRAKPHNQSRVIPALARWTVPALLASCVLYFGAQQPAHSQIESRQISAPLSPTISHSAEKPTLPKAPQQVELPAPAPVKIFPGLEEPLVATGPVADEQENKDLDIALAAFHDAPVNAPAESDYSDYAKPLLGFITLHPNSNWNSALYLNLGLGYYNAGYFSRVFPVLEKSWQLGRNAESTQARLMVDRAVGELAKMHSRLGHAKELEALLPDIDKRHVGGPATELLQGAREAAWTFRHEPGIAYLCGPRALENLLVTLKADPKLIKIADDARSGEHGVSLPELAQLADKTKLKYTLIHREPGQTVPVPSVIHWKVNHYASIVSEKDGVFASLDPTFGSNGAMPLTTKAIDAEGSGYFLVPNTVMEANPKAGWRTVSRNSAEAKLVYGMGWSNSAVKGLMACFNTPMKTSLPPLSAPPMCIANANTTVVSLKLSDTPVGYSPQKGVSAFTSLTYNQREDLQPATFGFSNASPKWSHSWMRYIQDDPVHAYYQVARIAGGGGGYIYPYLGYGAGFLAPEIYDNSSTQRVTSGSTVTSYVRTLTDGSKEIYSKFDGATVYPRNIYLTSIVDAQGNTTTLNYDSSLRLTSVVDAMGRSTTFTYGLSSYPLLITQVTDPFGRASQLTYDTSQRLATITDPVGITSTFTYSATEPSFITNLATPYGTSTYSDAVNPNDTPEPSYNTRSLTLTDPLGYTDYLYFYQNTAVTPCSVAAGQIPTGVTYNNSLLCWRNTYYWDKHAFALGATMSGGVVQSEDFSKAYITHWAHSANTGTGVPIIDTKESVKPPLEQRTWFNYPGQPGSVYNGTNNIPSAGGLVLDNGTTQLAKSTFTTNTTNVNQLLTHTDPAGRVTKYNYATNNIDLLTVQQLTTSPSTYTTIATYGSYNSLHEPQTYTDAAGKVWNYTYNAAGQIATATDPNSGVTTWNYDGSGRLSTIVNANSQTVLTLTYDSADRVATRTDSQGYTLTYAYDNIDRVTSVTYPDGTTDLYDYTFQSGPNVGTASLEKRKYTDRLGRVTTWDYDADRRLTSVTEPISGGTTRTTTYAYYENGKLKNLTDANGNVTHWDIDIESRPTAKTYAFGTASAKTETYTYENTTSRLKSITDALGQVKTFTYGLDDRITGITYTSSVNTTPNVTFAYDTYFPRLTSMTDGTGTTTYGYTTIGTNGALKLSSIAGPYSNDTIGLTYDALGRPSSRNITGGNETFGYDSISRLTSHVTPLGTFTESYLGQTSQQVSQSVTNGAVTVSTGWGYDTNTNDRRLISITNSGVSRSFTLGYGSGPVNPYDIMSITDTAATGHPFATQSHAYTYDNVDRLLTGSATTPGNFAYGYDKLDNATTVTTPSGTVSPAPTYNVNNQLSTWASNTYAYDANGNTLSGDGTKTYKWNAENRLLEIDYVGTSNKTIFTYNGIGQRRVAAETNGGTTTTTRYLWCDDSICQTRDGSDTVLRRDLNEGEYNVSTGQKLIYMPDQLGSVRDVIDATTGNLVESYDYTPYGTVARSNGSTQTDFQYGQLFFHPASGLNLAKYRAQDGVTGRWLNRDPIREAAGPNLYRYGPNPINDIDPEGLLEIEFPIGRLGPIIDNPGNSPPISSPIVKPGGTTFDPTTTVPLPTTADPNGGGANNCDPCKGLRQQLADHEQKLADYKADPYAHDNNNFLGQGRDDQVITSRIVKLEKSIENFRQQLHECEVKHGLKQDA